MWHSDTISLALSRCWLHTHAPTLLHIHTQTSTHTHTHKLFPPGSSRCFRSVHMCHRDSICVRVYISCIQKVVFNCAMAGATWGHVTCLSLTNALGSILQTHTRSETSWQSACLTVCFYICSGFHNNNIKAIPERAFVGNPQLQTMWAGFLWLMLRCSHIRFCTYET